MTIKLKPEDEQLIQKRLQSGSFASAVHGCRNVKRVLEERKL